MNIPGQQHVSIAACPCNDTTHKDESMKSESLQYEIYRMWKVKIVEVATVLIGNFGSVSKNIDSDIQNFEIKCPIEFL